ncbi:MAG: TRAP transporter substrate-binding protein DctP [Spirochaetota bacterium]
MSNFATRCLITILSLIAIVSAPIGALTLKIASIAPQATPWGAALDKMAVDLARISGGELEIKVFHGGIAGDESDILRKLKIGQLQGAVFTNLGLNMISPEALTLSVPLLITGEDELDYILAKDRDFMQKKLEDKGFVVLAWSKAGWVHFFSKKPVSSPEDLKKMKMATTPSDLSLAQAFKTLGYNLIPVPLSEILVALSSGMVEASYQSPLIAGATQLFGIAKNMTDFSISPFVGAIVLSQHAWSRMSPDTRTKVQDYARSIEKGLNADIIKLEGDAIKAMQGYGLVINKTTPQQLEAWKKDFDASLPATIGTSFDKDFYEMVSAQLAEFRTARKK